MTEDEKAEGVWRLLAGRADAEHRDLYGAVALRYGDCRNSPTDALPGHAGIDCPFVQRAITALATRVYAAGRVDAVQPIRETTDRQAEDDGLWFHAEHASEAYLQQELRKLHAVIEAQAALMAGEVKDDKIEAQPTSC